jgi:CDP-4-dehydro-6-deoxyglucose reductase
LIFGSRHKEHILYKDELYALASENLIQYDIALSRETTELGIYHKGYVHQIYENRYRNNFNDTIFYICGWKAMVDEAQQNLTAMGVKPEQIRTELYG